MNNVLEKDVKVKMIVRINQLLISKHIILSLFSISFFISLNAQIITIDKDVTMLALGDSYTIGQSVPVDGRWPHQFMVELRNLGVSGPNPDYIATTSWTTKNLITGISAFLEEDKTYNLVSILIGVNNQYQGMSIEGYEPDLRKIIDSALEMVEQDTSRIFILSIPDYSYTPFGNGSELISKEIEEYNAIKSEVAHEYGISFINITTISKEGLDIPSLVASDGLHPSEKQYKWWVDAIIPNLELNFSVNTIQEEQKSLQQINVYPNPAFSTVTIGSLEDIRSIEIYDTKGRIIFDKKHITLPLEIDISHMVPGIYSIRALHSNSDMVFLKSLVIQE